jgi:pimeloyl-ACP methyl ester carboxylesterase
MLAHASLNMAVSFAFNDRLRNPNVVLDKSGDWSGDHNCHERPAGISDRNCRSGEGLGNEQLRELHGPCNGRRQLETLVYGPPDGFPLVFHHWTPGAAVPFGILERPATQLDFRVISHSRPGCGLSTPRPESGITALVADAAADTAATLDHLGLGEFVSIGWFGGGPTLLACAALMPERCRGVACLASPGPMTPKGWTHSPA